MSRVTIEHVGKIIMVGSEPTKMKPAILKEWRNPTYNYGSAFLANGHWWEFARPFTDEEASLVVKYK